LLFDHLKESHDHAFPKAVVGCESGELIDQVEVLRAVMIVIGIVVGLLLAVVAVPIESPSHITICLKNNMATHLSCNATNLA
jgi:hypothetical protein